MTDDEKAKDHLANERTFLAWVRTCLGIMALGFVIERFAVFMKEMLLLISQGKSELPAPSYQSHFGTYMVIMGVLICFGSFFNYKRIGKQISNNRYQPSLFLSFILTALILMIGIFLVVYLNVHV